MKKIVAVAALAIVTACSQAETEAEAEPTEEAVVEEAAVMAADGQPPAGTYTVTDAEGVEYTEVLLEDGTYTSTGPDGTVESGTWVQKSPDTYCYTPEGEEERCNTETIDENGVWTSTDTEGNSSTVVRVVAEEAAAPAA